ncbi:Nudix hydrolase [Striga asiatica]|uniref:Nudix hydrolase n=1 Tax=Striga asiatica TaxID=4170 RepID=A0A5A7QRP0_STRAF|nr:Nudix hydrolase [Striga asiatica]
MELKNMVALVSRTGRHMQRYNFHGHRQVVGCIPYRYKSTLGTQSIVDEDDIEVLVITSQRKGKGMLFPKVSVGEARQVCQYWWMKEALELFVDRLMTRSNL